MSYYLNNILIGIIILICYLLYSLVLSNLEKNKIEKIRKEKEYEFANLLGYLLVFLENNFNVYQSLQLSMGYCKELLANDIEKLLDEINQDKSILPYQNFAKQFDSNVVYQVIMMIYQLDVNGYDAKYLNNFPSLISNMKQARIENIINTRKTNMSFMTVIPTIALMLVVFTLIFYIIMTMGGMM